MSKLMEIETNFGSTVKVSEVKAAYIKQLIELAAICPKIESIILFGSSLDERCTEYSDIDFIIVSELTVGALCNLKSYQNFSSKFFGLSNYQDYDVLYFKPGEIEAKCDKITICKEIYTKGREVYRRKDGTANIIVDSKS